MKTKNANKREIKIKIKEQIMELIVEKQIPAKEIIKRGWNNIVYGGTENIGKTVRRSIKSYLEVLDFVSNYKGKTDR